MKTHIFARILLEQIVSKYSKQRTENQLNQPNKTQQNKQNQQQPNKIQLFSKSFLKGTTSPTHYK